MRLIPLLLAVGALPLAAASITIANSSFETATLPLNSGNGNYNNVLVGSAFPVGGTLSNWTANSSTVSASVGAFAPTPGGNNWTSTWWGGSNIAILQVTSVGSATLSQVLGATLANNTTYTLSALIGRRQFTPFFNYAIELWAGSTLLGSASNLSLAANSSGSDSLVYSSGAANALTGQALQVVLRSTNTGIAFTEAFFDNVTLDGTGAATPEPATWMLAGIGLLALPLRRALKRLNS